MKTFKKRLLMVLLIFTLAVSLPLPVLANSPIPAEYLTVLFSNLPQEAVYADLLIKMDKTDPNYVDFQSNAYADDAQDVEELVNYSKGNYRSFTFHYKNAKSNMQLKQDIYDDYRYVKFCDDSEYMAYLTQYEDLRSHYNDIKLAVLDKDFHILFVTEATQLPKENNLVVFGGIMYYDAANNSFEFDTWINIYFFVFGGFFSIFILFLSIGIEVVVSLFFDFKGKQIGWIAIINACTQIVMRLLYLVLPFTYLIETIMLEVLVYGGEFLIYRKCIKDATTTKIALYTVVANTVSLLIGIFLDCYILA